MSFVLGIDIGGTNIKAALLDATSGACLDRRAAPTRDGEMVDGRPAWAVGVRELSAHFEKATSQNLLPTGISAPGLAAHDGSKIVFMPGRMRALAGFDWPQFLHLP